MFSRNILSLFFSMLIFSSCSSTENLSSVEIRKMEKIENSRNIIEENNIEKNDFEKKNMSEKRKIRKISEHVFLAGTEEQEIYEKELEKRKLNSQIDTILNITESRKFVYVNIPSLMLRIYENGKEIFSSKIIVGSPNSKTPEFETYIEGIRFNPSWTIPPYGNLEKSYNKKMKNPEFVQYLKEAGIIFEKREDGTYSFRQRPSNGNVLGKMRVLMPSSYNVYIHDTNRRDLFEENFRALSAGCIRVANWDLFSSTILKKDLKEIHRYADSNIIREIYLDEKIPVYIVYWTVEKIHGHVFIYNDIYGKGKITVKNIRLNFREFFHEKNS